MLSPHYAFPINKARFNISLYILNTKTHGIGVKFEPLKQDMAMQTFHLSTRETKTGGFP